MQREHRQSDAGSDSHVCSITLRFGLGKGKRERARPTLRKRKIFTISKRACATSMATNFPAAAARCLDEASNEQLFEPCSDGYRPRRLAAVTRMACNGSAYLTTTAALVSGKEHSDRLFWP